MKISGIRIDYFRGIRHLELLDLDRHINLFVGINGAGKSSLLDAISNVMSWFVARMQSNTGRGKDIPVNDISIHTNNGCTVSIQLNGWDWCTLYRSREMVKTGKSDLSVLNQMVKDFRMREDPNASVPVFVHYGVGRSVADIPLRIKKSERNGGTADAYTNALVSRASFRDFFAWFREQEDLENEHIREDATYRDRGMEAIREAMKKVFPEFGDMRVRRSPRSIQIRKGNDVLRLEQLSDGEKCYIALVCDLTRRLTIANPGGGSPLTGEGIVLIDEIDLHLHPEWQRDVVSKLVSTFPNCQFFMTTHSPIVASDVEGKVFAMTGGQAEERYTYGKDSEQILASTFNVLNARNKQVQALIDDTYAVIHSGNEGLAKEMLQALSEKIGADDPVIARLNVEMVRQKARRQ